MKLKSCEVFNFGSYARLSIDFEEQGLTLVYGPTGSGKSTLMDAAPWILYGITAKDGNVDEIRSWQTPDEPTKGVLNVKLSDGEITVTRIRGAKPSENDLYWVENPGNPDDFDGTQPKWRGKDISDTQKLLSNRLAVSSDSFLASAYFHEFSQNATFFTAKAKDRRSSFARIANLSFPDLLAMRTTSGRKATKAALSEANSGMASLSGSIRILEQSIASLGVRGYSWDKENQARIQEIKTRSKNFEKEKESKIAALQTKHEAFEQQRSHEIDDLLQKLGHCEAKLEVDNVRHLQERLSSLKEARCSECGGPKASEEVEQITTKIRQVERLGEQYNRLLDKLHAANASISPYPVQIEDAKALTNHYDEQLDTTAVNPYTEQLQTAKTQFAGESAKLEKLKIETAELQREFDALVQLYDLSFELRGAMLQKAVKQVEEGTNAYLEKYFDSEIRVEFALEGADNLEVGIQKSGYNCVYRQLSKGQRGLLKLCFAVSNMELAANNAGVEISTLFMDEALDGLDSDLKVKAFGLFEELSTRHGSIYVIDHSPEVHQLFHTKIKVELVGDYSEVEFEQS